MEIISTFWTELGLQRSKGTGFIRKCLKNLLKLVTSKDAPAWRSVIYTGAVTSAQANLTGAAYEAENRNRLSQLLNLK